MEVSADEAPFGQLDFLYTPSDDVASDMAYFADVLGGRIVFAVENNGVRVAAVALSDGPPLVLLTDHLEGRETIFIYRVDDLEGSLAEMEARGWARERSFEIAHGPCCSFTTPGGKRVALYQLTRAEAARHFDGRRDF
jgi:hypothetical protein